MKLKVFSFLMPALLGYTLCFSQNKEIHNDAIKVNLAAAATKIYSVQLEKGLTKHLSFTLTGFYRQKSGFLFSEQMDRLAKSRGLGLTGVDFEYIFIDQAQIGVKGFSPELRYYIGNKPSRFFVSLFGQMENFDMTVPASLKAKIRGDEFEFKAPVDFNIKTMSGGILIGRQFRWNRFGVDFVIIGPHIGKARDVKAEAISSLLGELTEDEKAYLRQSVIERFKLDQSLYGVSVGDEQADIKSVKKVPYFGLRGLGLNLFYYF